MSALDLDLIAVPAGVRLRLRVRPGARRNEIVGSHGGALKLSVTAAPEKGKANQAVSRLLASALDVPPSKIEIVAGTSSSDKVVVVPGMSLDEVRERIGRSMTTR